MKLFSILLLASTVVAQPTIQADGGARIVPPPPSVDKSKTAAASETLRYVINWPSGLSLGEGQMSSARFRSDKGDRWEFKLRLEAAVPGFAIEEISSANATGEYCSTDLEKSVVRGKRRSEEKTLFDRKALSASRATVGGGKTAVSTSACAKDALTFLNYARRELAQGRLPQAQRVYYGAAYQVRLQYIGAQKLRVADEMIDTDHLTATIKGPAAEHTVDLYFARDATRAPVLVSVPLPLGRFSIELVR